MVRLTRFVFFVLVSLLSAGGSAHAVQCLDPALTQAITHAMGRAPQAGECNPRLYGATDTDAQLQERVRKVLTEIYDARQSESALPTQRLPLKSRVPGTSLHGDSGFPRT